jgi:ribosomal small subunit protein bTHX
MLALHTPFPSETATMGRGDKKTKRGKIAIGSFGNRRPRLRNKKKSAAKPTGK